MERRRDPWGDAGRSYTYDEFVGYYGPEDGHKAWMQAGRPRSRYYVGQAVKAVTSLKGEEGQTVNKGDIGKVTAVPGPGSNIDRGAVAEVLINSVRFDAKADMIEPANGGGGGNTGGPRQPRDDSRQKPPRMERRYDPNEPGHKKAYTHQEFIEEYGKKKGEQLWAKAGEGRVEKRQDPKEPNSGKKYTKKEFFDFYGEKEGLALWKKAGGESKPSRDEEKRPDPNETSGKKYTKKEFVEHYGEKKGKRLWEQGVDKRADPNETSGKKYTKKEFLKVYGEKKGAMLWKKAGEGIKPDKVIKATIERGEGGVIGWSREGLKIVEVEADSPAAKAEVKPLYKIVTVGGKKATEENLPGLLKDTEGPLSIGFIELRIDTTDPDKSEFTHSQFLEFYGKEKGAVMWKKAGQRSRQRKGKKKEGEEEEEPEKQEEEEKEEKEEEKKEEQ